MKQKGKVRFVNKNKNQFFPTLKKRVDDYFTEQNLSKHADSSMVLKTVVLLCSYILPFIFILLFNPPFAISLVLWLVMGLGIGGIGMSIMHDANHGAYSSNPKVNDWLGYTLNLAGGSVLNWKLQHNVLHHMYTNVVPMDEDIQDRLVVRLSPHTKVRAIHRFQWIYAFFFYGILTLYWVVLKDFVQFVTFTKSGVNTQTRKENILMLLKLIVMKIIYFVIFFYVPVALFSIPFSEILAGFLLMHFTAGLVLTVIFQLAHTVEGTAHPLANEAGVIENDWAIHQLQTTVNFSRENKWLSWYVGGLNFQVEHHLFPRICHVHYPAIAPIVKQTAEEFGLVYMENETFGSALQSHINTLQRFGHLPDWNEAIG
ncbi:fatty acid desaturase family protein [Arundinibacter roseus]|uniref:Acyl-CoA desaturase n=1 Tax=Arundinibacter roseus TaxID=2070510 RepID=A0A4R4KJM7_9BACT|nr:acyl-CoA desaturase [Arundinibacter roseus]TDB66779.1 acyl-CoA desaturase [Arundinibacter roseus]